LDFRISVQRRSSRVDGRQVEVPERAGSARPSISTVLSPLNVNARTAYGRSAAKPTKATKPAAPLTIVGRDVAANGRKAIAVSATPWAAAADRSSGASEDDEPGEPAEPDAGRT
jgi:phage tail tape-measure protein